MSKAKEILLQELNEQIHPEKVEDVIFWALENYVKSQPKKTLGRAIAYSIKERILQAESEMYSDDKVEIKLLKPEKPRGFMK